MNIDDALARANALCDRLGIVPEWSAGQGESADVLSWRVEWRGGVYAHRSRLGEDETAFGSQTLDRTRLWLETIVLQLETMIDQNENPSAYE